MIIKTDISRQPQYWSEVWEETRKSFSIEARFIRSEAEMIDYWNQAASKYQQAHSTSVNNPRVEKLLAILNREKCISVDYDVLDIGCGPGNYSLPLADACRHVTALDSSVEMCRRLEQNIQAMGIENVKVLHRLWEKMDIAQEEMTAKYDLVLASMTTAVSDFKTLEKMNQASRANCCLAFWANKGINQVQEELWGLIFNEKAPDCGMVSVIYPFNLLFSLGFYPKIEFIDTEWTHCEPIDEAVESLCNYFWLYIDITPRVKKIIVNYVNKKAHDGFLTRGTYARIGIITWKAQQTQTAMLSEL
jgi:16S rRNA G527 N7-methylase RsmG